MSSHNTGLQDYIDRSKKDYCVANSLIDACLDKLTQCQDDLAYFNLEKIKDQLAELEKKANNNCEYQLYLVPVVCADNIIIKNWLTEVGSSLLKNFTPMYQATVVDKLQEAGALIVAKSKLPELGISSIVDNKYNSKELAEIFTAAKCLEKGTCLFAIQTEVAGEARIAGSYYNLVTFKPSQSLVSRYGIVSAAPSLEAMAINAKSVEDVFVIMPVVTGYDQKDRATFNMKWNEKSTTSKRLDGKITVAIENRFLKDENIQIAQEKLTAAGVDFININIELLDVWDACHDIIYCAEISGQLSRYDGIRYGKYPEQAKNWQEVYSDARSNFTDEVKKNILAGTYSLSVDGIEKYYNQARRLRNKIIEDLNKILLNCDGILLPGNRQNICCGANLSGCPAINISVQKNASVEIWGKQFDDEMVLSIAKMLV